MLDMGFEKDIRKIVQQSDLNKKCQTVMFSATFPKEIRKLASDFLKKHAFLKVGRVGATASSIFQIIKYVEPINKRKQLLEELQNISGLTLIFVQTKKSAESLAQFLNKNRYYATAIHGNLSQQQREEALKNFREGESTILVATGFFLLNFLKKKKKRIKLIAFQDIASRGLDIENVTHVINLDLPHQIDDYVHRIGRTARIGNTGTAISFYSADDRKLSKQLIKVMSQAGQNIPEWLQQETQLPILQSIVTANVNE